MSRAGLKSRRSVHLLLAAATFLAAACGDEARQERVAIPVGPVPDSFRVAFETTRGRFVVEVRRDWAPLGADQLYRLVGSGFLDDNGFFRVLPGFIVQFGASPDHKANEQWDSLRIADDPRVERNRRGTLAFAHDGPGTRTHQLFVNLKDNDHLDSLGFVPIGRVVEGMAAVDSVYSGYRQKPDYHLISTLGNAYLKRMFPRLDYVRTARIIR